MQYPSSTASYSFTPFSFQPQPTWGGIDYYRAHALNPGTGSLYEDAWGRVRDRSSISGGLGVGLEQARRWHRCAYDSPGEIHHMLPEDIGHAAAYQAYKSWLRDGSLYDVVGDRERQREGLVGIAVAEVTRLLQYNGRSMDHYAQSMAAEAAAHTVTRLFYQAQNDLPGAWMRTGSYSGPLVTDPIDDTWARPVIPGRSRSLSRSRSGYGHRHYTSSPSPHRYLRHSHSRVFDEYTDGGFMPEPISHTPSYGGYPASYSGTSAWPASMTPSRAYSMPGYTPSYQSQPLYSPQPVALSHTYQGPVATPVYTSQPIMAAPTQSQFGYAVPSYAGSQYAAQPTVVIVEKKKSRHRRD